MKRESLYGFLVLSLIAGTTFAISLIHKTPSFDTSYGSIGDVTINQEIDSDSINENDKRINDSRSLLTAVDCSIADKDDIYHLMLNSIQYFDKVSGTMLFTVRNTNYINVVDFQCSISDSTAYSKYTQYYMDNIDDIENTYTDNECTAYMEIFCDSINVINVDHFNKLFKYEEHSVISLDNVSYIPDEERFKKNKSGQAEVFYLPNPTNVFMSNQCLFPQELAIGYLHDKDLWEIVDTTEYNNRVCYVIEGVPTSEYGEKLNVEKFKFWVDSLTGILVKYEGYDSEGNINGSVCAKNLKFEEDADPVTPFNSEIISNYSNAQ